MAIFTPGIQPRYRTSELKLLVQTRLPLVISYFSLHSEYQINIRLDNTGHTGRKLLGNRELGY